MASETDKNAGRADLPFEPKRDKKRTAKTAGNQSSGDQSVEAAATKNKSGAAKSNPKSKALKSKAPKSKAPDSASSVSARAQARADEILAGNRQKAKAKAAQAAGQSTSNLKGKARSADSGAIPEAVSRRMLRRMAVLSGGPVFLGVGIFFLAYYLQSRELVTFPPVAVLLVTMGCFGLGVVGLTYGVLSASWDTEPGSWVGLSEFKLNISRVMEARRSSKT